MAEGLRPIAAIAEAEALEITEALGGTVHVTPQQRILIEDLCAVGIALRGTLALYLQEPDPELGSRLSTMASTRRASLALLGLSRFQHEVSLDDYLQTRAAQDAAEDAIPSEDAPEPQPTAEACEDAREERDR